VSILFTAKSAAKCTVTVQHDQLPSAAAVKRMKSYWRGMLERLSGAVR
jgi:hypothetical protein